MMEQEIKDVLLDGDMVLIFSEFAHSLVDEINEKLDCGDNEPAFPVSLGYDKAEIYDFEFLGNIYPCARIWFDHEYETARETYDYLTQIKGK